MRGITNRDKGPKTLGEKGQEHAKVSLTPMEVKRRVRNRKNLKLGCTTLLPRNKIFFFFPLTTDRYEHSPSRYFVEICRTAEGQTAESSLNVEAAFIGRAGVDPCSALINI